MPEYERRAIFGLMVGNEGKTRVPVYHIYTQAGFDPDKDMLQAPITPLKREVRGWDRLRGVPAPRAAAGRVAGWWWTGTSRPIWKAYTPPGTRLRPIGEDTPALRLPADTPEGRQPITPKLPGEPAVDQTTNR